MATSLHPGRAPTYPELREAAELILLLGERAIRHFSGVVSHHKAESFARLLRRASTAGVVQHCRVYHDPTPEDHTRYCVETWSEKRPRGKRRAQRRRLDASANPDAAEFLAAGTNWHAMKEPIQFVFIESEELARKFARACRNRGAKTTTTHLGNRAMVTVWTPRAIQESSK